MNTCPRCEKAERERDDALALVNTLQAWRADAEKLKVELDDLKRRISKMKEALKIAAIYVCFEGSDEEFAQLSEALKPDTLP
jgi:hypothetical protein